MSARATRASSSQKSMAVASAHPLASAAGLKVLKKGGNAVDAAVATSLALGVVAPAFSGIGGGGFFLVHLRGEETLYIDYREVAPRASRPDMFELDEEGEPIDFASSMGHRAVGVPGTVAGLTHALENYGRLKFSDVASYAIDYARKGFAVSRFLGYIISNNVDNASQKLRRFPETGRTWLRQGRTYRTGERKLSKDLADSLELIGREGRDAFYSGPLATAIAGEISKKGGEMDGSDLAQYSVEVRKPVTGSYRGLEIHTMPPPSMGGLAMLQLLNIFENMDLGSMRLNTAESIAAMAKGLAVVWPVLRREVADPESHAIDLERLSSKEYAARLWFSRGERGVSRGRDAGSQTTHLSVIDREGSVAAITESIECYFGSGVTAPGTGFCLNDTMHDFDPQPGAPNSIAPGKRPLSNMAPTLLLRDGEPYLVAGSAGGPRIVTATLQTILNVVDHSLDLQRAVDAPRIHYQGAGAIKMESRIGAAVRKGLMDMGFRSETPNYVQLKPGYDVYFGGVNAVMAGPRGAPRGAADPRRQGGVAVG
ncbi:MAG: gamma-glutamyltransferase [Thaumarchaeota archaeon]|nr:gamma-glutamyltransferase [Nitrososphaerota archaeon]